MSCLRTCRLLTCLMAAVAIQATWMSADVAAQQNWTRFRGANGVGVSDLKGLPTTWSDGAYKWNIELPGLGHAAPVVWGNKLFITSAINEGAERTLYCLSPQTGKRIWSRTIGLNKSHKHNKSSWASATPAVDGERVYVAFSDEEHYTLAAYDLDGQLVWRRLLGTFESQHGQGVSPIIFEDMVIIPNLQKGPSSIIAVDKRTGRTRWSSIHRFYRTSYSTPIIIQRKGEPAQLICASGALGVASLNPYTGRLYWNTGEFPEPRRTVASPVYAAGLILQSCGGGGKGTVLIAVDPSNPTDKTKDRIRYKREKVVHYVPTPIVYGKHVYLWNDNGVFSCIEAATGKNIWTKRVGGNFSGSPVCVDGKIYCMSEEGDCVVVAASPEYKLLGKTSLGDSSHSTPAVANGRLFLRTFHRLMCLEAAQP